MIKRLWHLIARLLPDELYIKIMYFVHLRKLPNFNNPRTFNEKLQWLKLNDRRPEYINYVDKYKVREYIGKTIGKKYLIPLLGVWDNLDKINFDKLPNQFVLKSNHNSGGIFFCKDKSKLDKIRVINFFKKDLKRNGYWYGREWPYKKVQPKIIAEKYMIDESETMSLRDYKFMCFNGNVKCSFVCSDRNTKEGLHVTFFDLDWNILPFTRHYPSRKEGFPKPKCYEEMIKLAEKLSQGIPFVRVDFYEINGNVYVGELTFYPGSGFEEFTPESADEWLGSFIKLPQK